MSTAKLSITKIPNQNKKQKQDIEHPRVPYMYLELLENKNKIRPEVVNKEYDPTDAESLKDYDVTTSRENGKDKVEQNLKKNVIVEEEESEISISDSEKEESVVSRTEEKSGSEEEIDEEDDDMMEEEDDDDDVDVDENESEEDSDEQEEDESMEEEFDDDGEEYQDEPAEDEVSAKSLGFGEDMDEEDDISQGIRNLDIDDEDDMVPQKDFKSSNGNTKDKLRAMLDDEYDKIPPKLSDLEKKGVIPNKRTIPNIGLGVDEDVEDDEDAKRELLFKFSLLKKSYNTKLEIPEFTIHSSYKRMVEVYENTLRHLSLESSVEQYKNILIGGFMVCEYVFGVWLSLDMAGYTQAQILNISQYERLLIELGSKNYTPEAQNWPVEFRLVGMIILNAVIFVVSKLILKKTGNNIMNMMNNNIRNQYTQSFENTANNFYKEPMKEERKKMKKPSFDFSTL